MRILYARRCLLRRMRFRSVMQMKTLKPTSW